MDIPQSTIQKMKMLSDDKLSIVVDLVNQLSLEDPKDIVNDKSNFVYK